ncbi:MAG: hypothetical protein ACOC44_04735 [Promethearchaeia archaeon]
MSKSESINSEPIKSNSDEEENPEDKELTKIQLIGYSALIIISIAIFFISMIGADPLTLIVAFGISLVLVYFSEKEIEEKNEEKEP